MGKILLIEDESLIALSLADALTQEGFDVHCESEGYAALATASSIKLSAAIIDLGLPDCSGELVARELRASHPTIPLIICTGFDANSLADVSEELEIRVLEKPFDEATLVHVIRQYFPAIDGLRINQAGANELSSQPG